MSSLDVVVGAQFGSEGKGHVTAQLVQERVAQGAELVLNVRVAGPNAGHTVVDAAGVAFPLRTIPVGAALDGPIYCAIAPGSEIDVPVLLSELQLLREAGHPVNQLYVSGEATILTEEHHERETQLDMHGKIGSTGKGIGACRADRIMRVAKRIRDDAEVVALLKQQGVHVVDDWESYIHSVVLFRRNAVIVEGTQGFGLGMNAGFYPQCTSSNTRAIDFLAMAGINPWHPGIGRFTVWACARVYPIRVAGNSGPLEGETSWDELGLEAERTTVTHKVRRVGSWDPSLIKRAVEQNGGSPVVKVALTMVDQKLPDVTDMRGSLVEGFGIVPGLADLVEQVQRDARADVGMVTTSPSTALFDEVL